MRRSTGSRLAVPALVLVGILLGAASARADLSIQIRSFSVGVIDQIGVEPFDPVLGTLDTVVVSIQGVLTVTAATFPNFSGGTPVPYGYSFRVNQDFFGLLGKYFEFDPPAQFVFSGVAPGTGQPVTHTRSFSYTFRFTQATDLAGFTVPTGVSGVDIVPVSIVGQRSGFLKTEPPIDEIDVTHAGVMPAGAVPQPPAGGGSIEIQYVFTSNRPVAVAQAVTTPEDTPRTITLAASDPNGDALTYAIVSGPAHGSLSGTPPNVTYTPAANYHGPDSFTFRARDALLDSNIATVSITVTPVNDPPKVKDVSVTTAVNTAVAVVLPGSDVDGDPLTFQVTTPPASGTLGGTPPNVTYTPKPGFLGIDTFGFRANDGVASSAIGRVTVSVKNGVAISDAAVTEGQGGTVSAVFTVTLAVAAAQDVTVGYVVESLSATAGTDYTGTMTGTLTIPAGAVARAIVVPVIGDKLFEGNETFLVRLTSATNAVVVDGAGVGLILNDDPQIGVSVIRPADATVEVGERMTYALTWTHPERWRLLATIDLRIRDERGAILWVRFHEPTGTFSVFNAASGRFSRPAAPGAPRRLETPAATVYLRQSSVESGGVDGPTVTLHLEISFKGQASGQVYSVEVLATDDLGNQQGFEILDALRVEPAAHP